MLSCPLTIFLEGYNISPMTNCVRVVAYLLSSPPLTLISGCIHAFTKYRQAGSWECQSFIAGIWRLSSSYLHLQLNGAFGKGLRHMQYMGKWACWLRKVCAVWSNQNISSYLFKRSCKYRFISSSFLWLNEWVSSYNKGRVQKEVKSVICFMKTAPIISSASLWILRLRCFYWRWCSRQTTVKRLAFKHTFNIQKSVLSSWYFCQLISNLCSK